MAPCLEVTRLVVEGDTAAMECTERLTIDGREFEFPIGVFLTVRDGRLLRVKVDREGTVDLPD
jgi:ketosteroid isomerase-like protein